MSKPERDKTVSIRKAAPADAGLVSVLATASFYEAYFEQDDPYIMASYLLENFAPERVADEIASADNTFLIIFRDGRAVGYAKLRAVEPHASVTLPEAVELQRIYLVERVWGTGLGEELLRACMEEARTAGKGGIWLGVWEENRRGLSFYAKQGFTRVGSVTFPYGETFGISAVMQLAI